MDDLRSRLVNRVQLTTDGHKAYLEAIEGAFGGDIDYAMLIKLYGAAPETAKGRYSPADCIGSRKMPIEDNPDPQHISTNYAERANLYNADAHAPLHPVDQRLFKEGREPCAFDGTVHDLLQLRQNPQNIACHPSDGSGCLGSALGRFGYRGDTGGNRAEAGQARSLQEKNFRLTHYRNAAAT
jgi:hypothetical protein